MRNTEKYTRQYFMPPQKCLKWTEKEYIEKAPQWCSVDLRDGNQALVVPMSLEAKLDFFSELVKIGFKEIEIGFPAANETEYEFCRALIERGLIPDDVKIQVLTQSREHIVEKTFEALRGAKNAIVHLYNSTSVAQRRQVFKKSDAEIMEIATSGAEQIKRLAAQTEGNFSFEYSPESFTGTEIGYALEICNAVIDIWKPTPENKVIINLPATVELSLPHVYASQIEYMSESLHRRDSVTLSVHTHNDRGCAIADTELALLAGAERVEGTLFGNGERTGNADIVTLALNLYGQGIDPRLDFSNIEEIADRYEDLTNMQVGERQPYAGELVFTAFSGSHQDAIAKGFEWREEHKDAKWDVPYIIIDPTDIGRDYQKDVIRINGQSGKGGIGYLLSKHYGINLPVKLREALGYAVKAESEHEHKELEPEQVYEIFKKSFVNVSTPLRQTESHFEQNDDIIATVSFSRKGTERHTVGRGNGRLDAVSDALKKSLGIKFNILEYSEHATEIGSKSQAMSYVAIRSDEGRISWGVGLHNDIISSSILALFSAVNRSEMLK